MLKKVENEIFEIVLKKYLHADLFIFNKNGYEFCFVNNRDLLLSIRTMLDLTIKIRSVWICEQQLSDYMRTTIFIARREA